MNHPNIARFLLLRNDLDTDDIFNMERGVVGKLNWEQYKSHWH